MAKPISKKVLEHYIKTLATKPVTQPLKPPAQKHKFIKTRGDVAAYRCLGF